MTTYTRLATVPVESVIPVIYANWTDSEETVRTEISGHQVGVTSLRLRTFARAHKFNQFECVTCKCKPSFFAVENFTRSPHSFPHINLYGVDATGKEILFTHDHITARALGGADSIKNVQLMCSPCNSKKGKVEGKLAQALNTSKKGKKHGSRN